MTTQRVERGWVPAESFGGRLALVRQHFGWNVKEAAMHCQVPVETWRGWERDHTQPRRYLEVCRMISEATGASYDWLLDGRHFPGPRNRPIDGYDGIPAREKITLRHETATPALTSGRAA